MTYNPDFEPFHHVSPTHAIMDNLELFQPAPPQGEPDDRIMPGDGKIAAAMADLSDCIVATLSNTPLEGDIEELLWGAVNLFHRAALRYEQRIDETVMALKESQQAQDGSEIRSGELEKLTLQARAQDEARDTFEFIRDCAAAQFSQATGSCWTPRSRSQVNHRALTSAVIDARDYIEARKRAQSQVLIPQGTRIAITGGPDYQDYKLVWSVLDKVQAKHPTMVLMHGGSPKGAELIAAKWAQARKIAQIAFKPDWSKHAKAAPFRRNDLMLEALPAGLIIFPGSGIHENMCDKARKLGIPVMRPVPKG